MIPFTVAPLLLVCFTIAECLSPEICNLPRKKGPCQTWTPRYYYKNRTHSCELFFYGGCQGNANNFKTIEECKSSCMDICNLPAKRGPCLETIPRFYYNTRTHSCKRFFYGGCQGNANNFKTFDECKSSCMADSELGTCNLPPEKGPCKAAIPRYFFNPRTYQCEKFIFGGCEGNANNFKTLGDCLKSCLFGS